MIYVNEKDLVVPGELLAEDDYYPGRGTFEDDGKICSKLLGLVSLRNKKISVIPLKSKYLPKKGDVVIGKIDDVRFSMWGVDINSPYSGILPASEVFGREKKELSRVFDIGDVLFLRIVDVDEVKKVKLGLKGRGMGKFKGGVIVDIAPTKVPRLIGKKGSMINMIKDKTGCKIVVGQNGLVWVKGNEDMEQIVKNIIKLIEREAHTSGLTDRIKNKLCLLIDGELPPEEEVVEEVEEADDFEEDSFEEGLKKPELQDFRDEVEKELAEEGFEDFDEEEELDDSEDDEFDEDDVEDFNDESEDYEDIDEDDLEDEDSEEDDELEDSEDEIEDFEDDISDEELEDVISDAISEEEDEIVDESVEEEDSEEAPEDEEDLEDEDSEEETVEETSEDVADLEDSEEEIVDESVEEEDSEEAPEEEVEEDVSKEDSEDDSKEEKSKKPNFIDTYEFINEQKKNNKSSFDLSRADNSKSPTLNISQGRGI
ncbi:MAG: exosome complex protein Rrp4 [Methanobrevibacter sp.]|nr:exosome complex protein Rrp4 [Methanobrevibacter sp.]